MRQPHCCIGTMTVKGDRYFAVLFSRTYPPCSFTCRNWMLMRWIPVISLCTLQRPMGLGFPPLSSQMQYSAVVWDERVASLWMPPFCGFVSFVKRVAWNLYKLKGTLAERLVVVIFGCIKALALVWLWSYGVIYLWSKIRWYKFKVRCLARA